MTIRPRRSALYMPAANARALEKARELPADCLILDLEDAVAPAAKQKARQQLAGTLEQGGYGDRELIVRVNGLDTPWGQADMAMLAGRHADAVLLPKISSPEQLQQAIVTMDGLGVRGDLPVWIMAETARCILDIGAIAAGHVRLAAIVMGTSDLARELRVRHTSGREGLLAALNLCVMAARANDLSAIDGVHLQLDDAAGLLNACEQGRNLGFDGKSLIHPRQLESANRVFGPDKEEIRLAQDIIAAWQEAEAAGVAVVVVAGRLVEELHVREARRTLALAAATAQRW